MTFLVAISSYNNDFNFIVTKNVIAKIIFSCNEYMFELKDVQE